MATLVVVLLTQPRLGVDTLDQAPLDATTAGGRALWEEGKGGVRATLGPDSLSPSPAPRASQEGPGPMFTCRNCTWGRGEGGQSCSLRGQEQLCSQLGSDVFKKP